MTNDDEKAALDELIRALDPRALLRDVARRLRELKGVEALTLANDDIGKLMFADGVCVSPLPRFNVECEAATFGPVGLTDVAEALDRISANLDQVGDLGGLLEQVSQLLAGFRDGSSTPAS